MLANLGDGRNILTQRATLPIASPRSELRPAPHAHAQVTKGSQAPVIQVEITENTVPTPSDCMPNLVSITVVHGLIPASIIA
jgi:hypothetical protein